MQLKEWNYWERYFNI